MAEQSGHSSTSDWAKKVLREYAYGLLAARDYSVNDIRWRLERRLKKICTKVKIANTTGLVEEIIMGLESKNFVNDRRFGENYIASRSRQKGKRLIQLELVRKGLGKELIGELMARTAGSDREAAMRLLERRGRWSGEDEYKTKQKALGLLVRNGFEYELARELVETWYKEKYNRQEVREDELSD